MPSDLKSGKQNLALSAWWFMKGQPAGNGWFERGMGVRQKSVGLHSKPIKAATCTLSRDHIPRYISAHEGYSVWHPSLGRDRELCREVWDGPALGQGWICKNCGLEVVCPFLWLPTGATMPGFSQPTGLCPSTIWQLLKLCSLHKWPQTEVLSLHNHDFRPSHGPNKSIVFLPVYFAFSVSVTSAKSNPTSLQVESQRISNVFETVGSASGCLGWPLTLNSCVIWVRFFLCLSFLICDTGTITVQGNRYSEDEMEQ